MTLLALDLNATRIRAALGATAEESRSVPLEGQEAELPLAVSLEGRYPEVGRAGSACPATVDRPGAGGRCRRARPDVVGRGGGGRDGPRPPDAAADGPGAERLEGAAAKRHRRHLYPQEPPRPARLGRGGADALRPTRQRVGRLSRRAAGG